VLVIDAPIIMRGVIERNEEMNRNDENGSIYAESHPKSALIYRDKMYCGLSPTTVLEVSAGTHTVTFRKFGYFDCEREALVTVNQTTQVHCDLREIPEIKLKLSAEPTKITADGTSKST
jgi:hypothetical protein